MLFSSLSFIYVFLPAILLVYVLLPKQLKNGWLLLASILFYFSGEPKLFWLLPAEALLGYIAGRLMERMKEKKIRKIILVSAAGATLSVLFVFKYAGIWTLPVGISFFSFQILGYLGDVYAGKVTASRKPVDFMSFIAMFPQLIAGPIVRYETVQKELEDRKVSGEGMAAGIRRFLCGLGKKVLIADSLAVLVQRAESGTEESVLMAWLAAVGFLFQLYYDFSGYSDMAIGLGRMLGFHFPENFNYPYMASSVTHFWRRWHMTLGSWFRDYVYIPLGGNRVSRMKWIRNVAVVWFLTGIWHGSTMNYAIWGMYFGCFLVLEKLAGTWDVGKQRLSGHVYTILVVTVGMVIFRCEDLGELMRQLQMMFPLTGSIPLAGVQSIFYLKNYAVLLLIAAAGCGPWVKKLRDICEAKTADHWLFTIVETIGCIAVLLWVTAHLVDGSFSPFLYFRF